LLNRRLTGSGSRVVAASRRGVDQILPHPGDPELREPGASDAGIYVRLAERASGPIPRPVGFDWPWGEALRVADDMAPDVRVINLEARAFDCADAVGHGRVAVGQHGDQVGAVRGGEG
jgi:poly-gamma-glutamate capsule biosynthesis protein CapA/YwtB (metallophosphatase superfamily)